MHRKAPQPGLDPWRQGLCILVGAANTPRCEWFNPALGYPRLDRVNMSGLYLPLQRSSILGRQRSGDAYPVVSLNSRCSANVESGVPRVGPPPALHLLRSDDYSVSHFCVKNRAAPSVVFKLSPIHCSRSLFISFRQFHTLVKRRVKRDYLLIDLASVLQVTGACERPPLGVVQRWSALSHFVTVASSRSSSTRPTRITC